MAKTDEQRYMVHYI